MFLLNHLIYASLNFETFPPYLRYYLCLRDGNDALNILMFDQYGNYVVQTMIDVALAVKQGRRKGRIEWYNRLVERVSLQQGRLLNFSSGKRIISKLIEV